MKWGNMQRKGSLCSLQQEDNLDTGCANARR
jgi:hypothetical protein